MCPDIHILGLRIPLYGLCVLAGFIAGLPLCVSYAKRKRGNGVTVFYILLITFVGVFAGGKLMAFLYRLPALFRGEYAGVGFWGALSAMFEGSRYFGYLFGGWLTAWLCCRAFQVDPYEMMVVCVPAVPLIEAFVRLGCLLSGCCYGIPWTGSMAVTFPIGAQAPSGVPLFPWQTAALIMNLVLFVILIMYRRRYPDASAEGRGRYIGGMYIILYGALRFALEFFRGDGAGDMLLGLSTAQWLCAAMIIAGVILTVYIARISRASKARTDTTDD